jgi:hypothetical protein
LGKDIIVMSRKEAERLKVIHKIMGKELTQIEGGKFLKLSERQVRRMVKAVRLRGAAGIVHGNRGRESSRKMPEEEEKRIGQLIETRYNDFGPTLASEKLWEREKIDVSREKLRQIMMAEGLWKVHRRKRDVHQWRERKAHFGEMVQMDGSDHDWLEGRGPEMVFMGYVDDATGDIFGRFYDYEGVYPAMDSFRHYIDLYGLPSSVYFDKHSTYKTRRQPDTDELLRGEWAKTQFARALGELGVECIHAHSPQAKGRVERAFGTLQDRLIKEMRLAQISTKEEANRFLETYLPKHNLRFAKEARQPANFHTPLPKRLNLDEILCLKGTRTINNGYVIQWKRRLWAVEAPSITMNGRKVEVMEHFDGRIDFRFNGRYLKVREVTVLKKEETPQVKAIVVVKRRKGKYIPPANHPWRRHNPALHHNCYLERI